MTETDRQFVRDLIERNRYLTLATTDGESPWIAPLEYISDEDLNLYFFSPIETAHARHIAERPDVAVAVFDAVQPEYEPAPTMRLAGVQFFATAEELAAPYPALIERQIAEWRLPMPPYAAFRLTPQQWFIPVIRDGVNHRIEVEFG